MENFFVAFQFYTEYICLALLGAIELCCLAAWGYKAFRNVWRRTHTLVFFAICGVATIYGGGKTNELKDKTSTDDNIDLYSFVIAESNAVEVVSETEAHTNYVETVITLKVSDSSVTPQPIWFRDSTYNNWTNITEIASFNTAYPILDAGESGNGTNVYKWVSSNLTNNYSHTFWYIGTNLPAVDVDVEGNYIVLDEFCMTSKKVHIKFHLNPTLEYPPGTMIEVQRLTGDTGNNYEVVDTILAEANVIYQMDGFNVGKRTRWRLHMAVTVDD